MPHPSLLLSCIRCRAFIAEGGTASSLQDDHSTRTTAAAAPAGSPNRSSPPALYANRLHASVCPFAVVLRISVATNIVPSSSTSCHGGARALRWGGHWLMTMKRRVAEKNADNNDHAVLLPLSLPSPSLAHVVAEVLSVRTLFDTPLLIPPSSSALPPTHLFGC